MNQQVRDDIAFWACMVLAHVSYYGGSKPGAAVWFGVVVVMTWRARRAARIAAGLPSFWQPPVPDHVDITHKDEFGPVFSDGVRREWRPRS